MPNDLIKAEQKFVIMSPKKIREVAALVRKLTPKEAFEKLPFVKKRAALPLCKVIGTAIANAKQKGVGVEDLAFFAIQINEGPKLKRFRAGARGRAKPYKKRMSHIRVILVKKENVEKEAKASVKKVAQERKPKIKTQNPKSKPKERK